MARVIATAVGFMGRLLSPGEEFDAPDGLSGSWFKPVRPATDTNTNTSADATSADARQPQTGGLVSQGRAAPARAAQRNGAA